jgi:hypothetical protein
MPDMLTNGARGTRLIFGQAQVAGATGAFYFVETARASPRTVVAVVATATVSVVSLLIFRVIWKTENESKKRMN